MSRNSLNTARSVPKDHLMWRVVDYAGGEWKALFDRMKPGDSFQLPTRSAAAASNAKLHYCGQVEGARFVLRKVSGSHTRVWRVA